MIGISESQNLRISESQNHRQYASRYQDLLVYRKSFDISLDIHKASLAFPRIEQFGGLGDQMRRASKSICANLAEGFAKQQRSKAEFKRFLLMALGSAQEMQVWTDYAIALGYISEQDAQDWVSAYDEVVRMLQSLYSKT